MSTLETASISRPNFDDESQFVARRGIPLMDTFSNTHFEVDPRTGKKVAVVNKIDEADLDTLIANSAARAARGDYGLIIVGHTNPKISEKDQPPVVGLLANHRKGIHNGVSTALGDLFFFKKNSLGRDPEDLIVQHGRKSVEIRGQNHPKGFFDAVAMLTQTPARDLGLIPSKFSSDDFPTTMYACPCSREETQIMPDLTISESDLATMLAKAATMGATEALKAANPADLPVTKHSADPTPDPVVIPAAEMERMTNESAAIVTTRFQAELQAKDVRIAELESRLNTSDATARQNRMEAVSIQLESEGYELDRPYQVKRFMMMSSQEDIDAEIAHIKKYNRRSPVGDRLIGGLGPDLGANGVDRTIDPNPVLTGDEIVGGDIANQYAATLARSTPGRLSPEAIALKVTKEMADKRVVGGKATA